MTTSTIRLAHKLKSRVGVNWELSSPFQYGTVAAFPGALGPSSVDVYLDNNATGAMPTIATGLAYISTYTPQLGDAVLIKRGVSGGLISDRVVIGQLATAINGAWFTPTLGNGWVANITPQYRINDDVVRLRGSLKSGTSATTAFTLPAGFVPATTGLYPSAVGSSANVAFTQINAGTGTVQPVYTNSQTVYLDGITFTID